MIGIDGLRLLFRTSKDENGIVGITGALGRYRNRERDAEFLANNKVSQIQEYINADEAMKPKFFEGYDVDVQDFIRQNDLASDSIEKFRSKAKGGYMEATKFSTKLKGMGQGLLNVGKSALAMAGNMLVWTLVAKGIELAYKAIDKYVNRVKYAQEAIDEITQKWDESAQKQKEAKKVVDDYGEEYAKLSKGVDTKTNTNLTLSTAEYERYLEIVDAIGASSLGIVKSYDEQGHAILNLTDTVNGLNEALERMADKNRGEILGNSVELMNELQTSVFDGSGLAKQTDTLKKFRELIRDESNPDAVYDFMYGETGSTVKGIEIAEALSKIGIDYQKMFDEAYNDDGFFDKSKYREMFLAQFDAISSAITDNEAQIASLIAPARNLVSTIISDAFADNKDSFKGIASSVQESLRQAAGELDYTFFEDKTGAEIQDAIQAMFTEPFLNLDNQKAISELDKASQDFQKNIISHSDLMKIGQSTIDTLQAKGVTFEVAKAISAFFGVDGESVYSETIEAAKNAISGDTSWIDKLNISQLQYLRTLEDISKLTEAEFMEGYNKSLEAQSLALDTLTSSYTSYLEAREKAASLAKEIDEQGYMTPEQYKELDKSYRGAIRQDTLTGGYYIDYDELRKIDKESEKKQVEDAIKGREEAQNKHNAALKEYNALIEAKTALDNKDVVEQANIINTQADLIDGYNILINSIERSTSAFQVWRNAMQQGEIGDEFRETKSAIDAINEGLKSGRVNTNAFKASAELIFGDNWQKMYEDGTLGKELKQYQKFFDSDGELDRGDLYKYAADRGVLKRREDGSYFADGTLNLSEVASKLGFSEAVTAALFRAANEYILDPEKRWKMQGLYENEGKMTLAERVEQGVADKMGELKTGVESATDGTAALGTSTANTAEKVDGFGIALDRVQKKLAELTPPTDEVAKEIIDDLQTDALRDEKFRQKKGELPKSPLLNVPSWADELGSPFGTGVAKAGDSEIPVEMNIDASASIEEIETQLTSVQAKIDATAKMLEVTDPSSVNFDGLVSDMQSYVSQFMELQNQLATLKATITVNEEGTDAVNQAIDNAARPRNTIIRVRTIGAGGNILAAPIAQAAASGTDNAKGGTTLVGEIEPEIIVRKNEGSWYLATNPQLTNLDRGDIVFNGKDTKKILAGKKSGFGKAMWNGGVVGGKSFAYTPRRRDYDGYSITGEYIAYGTNAIGRGRPKSSFTGNDNLKDDPSGGGGSSGPDWESLLEAFNNMYDWIQRALEVAKKATEKLINEVAKKIGYVAKNRTIDKAIESVSDEIAQNQAAYDRYMEEANKTKQKLGLSDDIVNRIQNGTIDISEYNKDEKMKERIEAYKKWYDLSQQCLETIEELKESQRELALQKLTNITDYYENRMDRLTAQTDLAEAKRQNRVAHGREIRKSDYTDSIISTKNQIATLVKERAKYDEQFQKLLADGTLKYDSDEWHEYIAALETMDTAIVEANTELAELLRDMRSTLLDSITTKYGNKLDRLNAKYDLQEANRENKLASGEQLTKSDYTSSAKNLQKQIKALQQQREAYADQLQAFIDDGSLREGSDEWHEYIAALEEMDQALVEVDTSLLELLKDMRNTLLSNITTKFENKINRLTANQSLEEAKRRNKVASGTSIEKTDYTSSISSMEKQIDMLRKERKAYNAQLQAFVADGSLVKGSDEWYEYIATLEEMDLAIVDANTDLLELIDEMSNIPLTNLRYALDAIKAVQAEITGQADFHVGQGGSYTDKDYEQLIGTGMSEIENLREQNDYLRQQQVGLDVLSEKYQEYQQQINSNTQSIWDMMKAQEEWNDAIADLKIDALQKEREELSKENDELQRKLDMQQALEDLEKAKQRTKLVYRAGIGFSYEADKDAVRQAERRIEELRHAEMLAKIDDAIEAIEENKKTDNIYDATGGRIKTDIDLLTNGQQFYDLIAASAGQLTTTIMDSIMNRIAETTGGALVSSSPTSFTLTMGDINLEGVQDPEGLARAIVQSFPARLAQELHTN